MKLLENRNIRIIIILAFVSLITSCKNSYKSKESNNLAGARLKNKDLIIIDLDTIKQIRGLYSDFFLQAQFIPLETSGSSLIGNIGQLELFNDTVYILDSKAAKCIFVFALNGKFVKKIGMNGKGPGEWVQPANFCIDKSQRIVYVLDSQLQRITLFNLNGVLIRQFSLNNNSVRSHHIESDNGRIFLDARHFGDTESKDDYMVREIDNNGQEINKYFSLDNDNKGWTQTLNFSGSGTFYSSPSYIRFVELFMDTIFSITDKGMLPFIAIKSSEILNRETIKEIQSTANNGDFNAVELFREEGYWAINSYIENDDIIYFTFNGRRRMNVIIIKKSTSRVYYLKGLFNDLTFKDIASGTILPNFYSGEKNIIVGAIQNAKYFQESIRTNNTNLDEEEKEKFLKVSELDNPILIIVKTKSIIK